jgi:hypothetical protein
MSDKKVELLTVGSDPEFFIRDTQNEVFVSSEGLIGGSKKEPRLISERGHGLQEDNVMVEFTMPPVKNADEFIDELDLVINHTNRELEDINPNYHLSSVSSAEFTDEQLNTEQACQSGCDPDRNAWFDMDNIAPQLPKNTRYAGGHIHLGYKNPTREKNLEIVKALDMFLGLPAVMMDVDDRRKELYGTPGRYRDKSYGLEYRTLSNFWLENSKLIRWTFDRINQAIDFVNSGQQVNDFVPVWIETVNKEEARKFCEEQNIPLIEYKNEMVYT